MLLRRGGSPWPSPRLLLAEPGLPSGGSRAAGGRLASAAAAGRPGRPAWRVEPTPAPAHPARLVAARSRPRDHGPGGRDHAHRPADRDRPGRPAADRPARACGPRGLARGPGRAGRRGAGPPGMGGARPGRDALWLVGPGDLGAPARCAGRRAVRAGRVGAAVAPPVARAAPRRRPRARLGAGRWADHGPRHVELAWLDGRRPDGGAAQRGRAADRAAGEPGRAARGGRGRGRGARGHPDARDQGRPGRGGVEPVGGRGPPAGGLLRGAGRPPGRQRAGRLGGRSARAARAGHPAVGQRHGPARRAGRSRHRLGAHAPAGGRRLGARAGRGARTGPGGQPRGAVLWRVELSDAGSAPSRPARARVLAADGTTLAALPSDGTGMDTVLPAGPAGRWLVLAERADPGWQARLDGHELAPSVHAGWAQSFLLPARGGHLVVEHRGWPWLDPVRLAVLGLALLAAVPLPGRRRRLLAGARARAAAAAAPAAARRRPAPSVRPRPPAPAGRSAAPRVSGRPGRAVRRRVPGTATPPDRTADGPHTGDVPAGDVPAGAGSPGAGTEAVR